MQSDYGFILPYGAPQVPPLSMQAFTYNTVPVDIMRGAIASVNVQIDADADFWAYSYISSYDQLRVGATPDVIRPYELLNPQQIPLLINIKDSGDSKDLNKNALYVGGYTGDAKNPYILQIPRRIRATANLQIQFQNVSTDTDIIGFQFTFAGNKIYYPSDAFGSRGSQ